ncbi:MAG: hypothetical protein AAF770_03150 [Bacteroidota bacterium]
MLVIFPHDLHTRNGNNNQLRLLVYSLFFSFSFLLPQLARQTIRNSFSNIRLASKIKSYTLKGLIKKGKVDKLTQAEILQGILLSFDEQERNIVPVIQFFLAKQRDHFTYFEKNRIIERALQTDTNYTIIEYLLQHKIYDKKMLLGKASYSFREAFSMMASRLLASITLQPAWKQRIFGKIFRIEVAILSFIIINIPFFKKIAYLKNLRKFFICLGLINTLTNMTFVLLNILILVYTIPKMYRPGYLIMLLTQKRYTSNSQEVLKLLMKYGANLNQKAYFFYPKQATKELHSFLRLYRIEHIGPIHIAARNNNLNAVKLFCHQNPKIIEQKAYIMTDKKLTPTNFLQAVITIQTIYTKIAPSKKKGCIQIYLPKQLCLAGTSMDKLLESYEKKKRKNKNV